LILQTKNVDKIREQINELDSQPHALDKKDRHRRRQLVSTLTKVIAQQKADRYRSSRVSWVSSVDLRDCGGGIVL